MKIQFNEWDLLRLIKTGIENGRLEATVRLIDEALSQEPKTPEATKESAKEGGAL